MLCRKANRKSQVVPLVKLSENLPGPSCSNDAFAKATNIFSAKISELQDNCIEKLHLGRYISGAIKRNLRPSNRRYTAPNVNFHYNYPRSTLQHHYNAVAYNAETVITGLGHGSRGVVGWCEGAVYLTSLGRPTDIGLQLGKACYPCSG